MTMPANLKDTLVAATIVCTVSVVAAAANVEYVVGNAVKQDLTCYYQPAGQEVKIPVECTQDQLDSYYRYMEVGHYN